MYTSESIAREENLFIAERHTWYDLCAGEVLVFTYRLYMDYRREFSHASIEYSAVYNTNTHIKNLDDISNFNTDSHLDLYIEIHMNCTIIVIMSSCIDLSIFRTPPVYSPCRYDHNYTKLTLSSRTFDGPNRST